MYGVKTFCSGAGGLDRALVLIRRRPRPRRPVRRRRGRRDWYRSAGLRASASHRVVFDGAPVLGMVGPIAAQPWFARDAVRTTATWAGLADAGFAAAMDALRAQGGRRTSQRWPPAACARRMSTIDLWMAEAARIRGADPGVRDPPARRRRRRVPDAARRGRARLRVAPARHGRRAGPRQARPRCVPAAAPARPAGRARRPRGARGVSATRSRSSRRSTARREIRGICASSAYEQAKYDATIAALGDRTYPFGLELGASIGVLSERLARRCGRLITLEPSPTAVARARERLAGVPNVDVRLGSVPEDLPEGRFDLSSAPRSSTTSRRRAGRAAGRARGADAAGGHAARGPLARPRHAPADRRRGPRGAARAARARARPRGDRTRSTCSTASSAGDRVDRRRWARPALAAARGYRDAGGAETSSSSPTTTARPTSARR